VVVAAHVKVAAALPPLLRAQLRNCFTKLGVFALQTETLFFLSCIGAQK
jgi:hypothetical protein